MCIFVSVCTVCVQYVKNLEMTCAVNVESSYEKLTDTLCVIGSISTYEHNIVRGRFEKRHVIL